MFSGKSHAALRANIAARLFHREWSYRCYSVDDADSCPSVVRVGKTFNETPTLLSARIPIGECLVKRGEEFALARDKPRGAAVHDVFNITRFKEALDRTAHRIDAGVHVEVEIDYRRIAQGRINRECRAD